MLPPVPLALQAADLNISNGGRAILQVAHLRVQAGEVCHLAGGNGAGKTTLLRVLAGELAYQGRLTVFGAAPGSLAARQATAFVPTDAALLDDLTVAEHLSFMAAVWHQPLEPLLTLARRLGLHRWLDDWPVTLSRGTRQKVALAAGLGLGLPLTLLDEPFATLDTAARTVLSQALCARAAAGGAVIVTTHGAELLDVPHRVLNIVDGRLYTGSEPCPRTEPDTETA